MIEIVQTAEQTAYHTLFLPESTGREAFSTLAGLATHTEVLGLGTGVVTIVARPVPTTVMAAATVDQISAGRLVLGLGTGPAEPGALDRLRAFVNLARAALAGDPIETPEGTRFRLAIDPPSGPIPIWLAALNPRAMRLAGEIADGALLNWCSPERVAFARERIREGAEASGRDPAAVTVGVYVRACVGQEPEPTLAALRAAAGQYASYPAYRRQFEAMGLRDESRRAAEAFAVADIRRVPEELVRAVCILGDSPQAVAALTAYREAGADLPIVYPVPLRDPRSSILGTLFAFAPHPAVEPWDATGRGPSRSPLPPSPPTTTG